MTVEYKDARFKLESLEKKQDEDGNEYAEFEGYGSVFSNEDLGRDIVETGAFAKTIQENPEIPLLWQHWMDEPIGINADLREDGKGLRLRGVINLAVAKGREAYALLKQGAIKGLSIGYDVVQFSIEVNEETGKEIRRLLELKLWEVSLVTFPMNQLARVEVVKARHRDTATAEVLEEIKSLRSLVVGAEAPSLTWDQTPVVLKGLEEWVETEVKEGRVLSDTNRQKLAAVLEAIDGARDPIKQLLDATEPGKGTTPELTASDPDSFQSLLQSFRDEAKALAREPSDADIGSVLDVFRDEATQLEGVN